MPSLTLNMDYGQLLFGCWQLVIYLPSFELVITFKLLSSSHPPQSSKSHVSRAVLELCLAFSKYLSNLQNGMPLLKQLCDHILLNPAIWIHTPAKVMFIDLGLLSLLSLLCLRKVTVVRIFSFLLHIHIDSTVSVDNHFWSSILFCFSGKFASQYIFFFCNRNMSHGFIFLSRFYLRVPLFAEYRSGQFQSTLS